MSEDNVNEAVYRWHQIMFRLDEMEEMVERGLTEEEQAAFDVERRGLGEELAVIEARLGSARLLRLKSSHESDRAYARQMRAMEEESDQ